MYIYVVMVAYHERANKQRGKTMTLIMVLLMGKIWVYINEVCCRQSLYRIKNSCVFLDCWGISKGFPTNVECNRTTNVL